MGVVCCNRRDEGRGMAKRSVISDVNLLQGAEAIAADMQGPDGQRLKLARVIDVHLGWFEQARRRGLEWNDIVALLFRAGATRSDGRPLSRGHLQSLVWRKQPAERQAAGQTAEHQYLVPASPKQPARLEPSRRNSEPALGRGKRQPAKPTNASPATLREQPERVTDVAEKSDAQPEGDALLAYMKRAARLRRDE